MIFTIAQASSLGVGSRSDDVITLQKVLIKKGYLKIANPTNYFGSLTKNGPDPKFRTPSLYNY